MPDQLLWENVQIGDALCILKKQTSTRHLVKYAGASGDFSEIHYDKVYAESIGLPGVIIHGALRSAFLGQLVTDWMGPAGNLTKLGCEYRGMDFPGDLLKCHGRITRKYTEGLKKLVDLEIWIENPAGGKTTPGWATVELPSQLESKE